MILQTNNQSSFSLANVNNYEQKILPSDEKLVSSWNDMSSEFNFETLLAGSQNPTKHERKKIYTTFSAHRNNLKILTQNIWS